MALFSSNLLSLLAFASLVKTVSGATHTVALKDMPVWTVGIGLSYSDMTIDLGHTLSFTSVSSHDVSLLIPPSEGTAWDLCTLEGIATASKVSVFASSDFAATNSEKHYTPPMCGVYYLACSVGPHCAYGQRVKVTVNNVDASECASSCAGADCVTVDSKQDVIDTQKVHGVKPALPLHYWGVAFYDDMSINVGDTVLFKTGAGFHDISTVPDATAYSSCTTANKVVHAEWAYSATGEKKISTICETSADCCAGTSCGVEGGYVTYTYTATTAGDVHFICSVGDGSHCNQGQKFKLTVNPDPTTTTLAAEFTKVAGADGANLAVLRSSAALLAFLAHLV